MLLLEGEILLFMPWLWERMTEENLRDIRHAFREKSRERGESPGEEEPQEGGWGAPEEWMSPEPTPENPGWGGGNDDPSTGIVTRMRPAWGQDISPPPQPPVGPSHLYTALEGQLPRRLNQEQYRWSIYPTPPPLGYEFDDRSGLIKLNRPPSGRTRDPNLGFSQGGVFGDGYWPGGTPFPRRDVRLP